MWPKLILLNGSSSAGKSTLATLLQESITDVPYLIFGFDDLVFMSPKRYWADGATPQQNPDNPYINEGVHMVNRAKPNAPKQIEAVFGPTFQKIINTMPAVVKTLIENGNHVIFDHVFHDKAMVERYNDCLANVDQVRIGVHCALEMMEQRERERGDRVIGRARGLYPTVHQHCHYNLEVQTDEKKPNEIVIDILAFIKQRQ